MPVKCPECGSEYFDEEPFKGTIKTTFTQCVKCGTAFFIKELKANWKRWNSEEHKKWCETSFLDPVPEELRYRKKQNISDDE